VADSEAQRQVGVLGATSLVGEQLLPLLTQQGWQVTAFSRRVPVSVLAGVNWRQLPSLQGGVLQRSAQTVADTLPYWICVAPIWVLPDFFHLLEAAQARRVVALSSTSVFTKNNSDDAHEQAMSLRLADAEARVQAWARARGVACVILRPTLIYGLGRDKNITEIARFIRRFGFFPLLGKASGLRQPIHAEDVAAACLAALQVPCAAGLSYNISGGETLTYRAMVTRIFAAMARRPHFLTVPLWAFRVSVSLLRFLPRYRHWSAAMAGRMNQDLVFDHAEAVRDLNFKPRAFSLSPGDLPL